jgi:hypothetical protein
MRGRTLSIACLGIVVLGVVVWFTRSPAGQSGASSDWRAASLPPTAAADPREPAARPVRRAAKRIDAAQRAQLRAAIERARVERERAEATAASAAPPATSPREEPEDVLPGSRERIRAHIREVAPLLAECYELERARQPDLAGNLQMRFTIEGEPGVGGIVSESEVLGGSLAQRPEMVTCVRETLFTSKFDPPEAGGRIVVEYPFVFGTE